MESEILQGFIKQAEDYLPMIRGGILICVRQGNTFGELDNALRQIVSLKKAASIIELDEIANICAELEQKLAVFSNLNQPMTERQSHQLLDKLTEVEARLTKICFNTDDFSENINDFIEESFGQFEAKQPEPAMPDQAAEFEIDEDIFSEKESSQEEILEEEFEEEFEIDEEMLEIFALEAEDLVRNINVNLEILVEQPNDREALLEIRRNAHTLKGSAGIIGLKKLSDVAHKVEDLLDFLAENELDGDDQIFELLLTSTDCFAALASGDNSEQLNGKIARIYDGFDEVTASLQKQIGKISEVSTANLTAKDFSVTENTDETPENHVQTANNQPRSIVRVSLEKLDDLVKIVSDLVVSRSVFEQRLAEFDRQIKELHNSTRRLQSATNKLEVDFEADLLQVISPKSKVQNLKSNLSFIHHHSSSDFDTLEFDRYTEFHQTTRELIETTSDTSAINAELDNLKSNLELLFDGQRRLIENMQDKLLRLRMVYFGSLAVRLQRTVRVTCDEEEKSAELLIEGENLEVDTQILDSLIEPLLHLLRNAVAHGIELPEMRRLLGKPESGKISLRVYSEGTHIIVVISDDGRGISASALKEKAVQNALITREKADSMSDEEAFSLIFLPGLTTADKLSQISGRGIGMNIIKTGVERQSGTISIFSEAHKGTTFTLRLPMALAVTRSMLVKCGGQIFALPLNIVKQINEISAEQIKDSLRFGDIDYRVLHLNELLNISSAAALSGENIPLLLIDILENPCVLIVDSIVKTEEIVIKPLGNPLQNLPELLGATILGDGKVVPVLDLIYLLNSKVQSPKSKVQSQPEIRNSLSETETKNQKPKTKNQKIMIVDDSPSVRHLTSNIIKKAGWTAIVAKDGLEALEILQDANELPDVVLTDVEMPRMDGYELLASIKRQENLREIPVVMITSRAGDKHRQKAFGLGVSAYLTKPFDDSVLLEKIRFLTESR